MVSYNIPIRRTLSEIGICRLRIAANTGNCGDEQRIVRNRTICGFVERWILGRMLYRMRAPASDR